MALTGLLLVVLSLVFAVFVVVLAGVSLLSGRSLGNWGWNDFFIVIATFLSLGLAASNCVGVHFGLGKPESSLSSGDIRVVLKTFWASQLLYKGTILATKISMIFVYIRIMGRRNLNLAVYICVFCFVGAYGLANIILTLLQCDHIAQNWDREAGSCLDLAAFWYANAASNILSTLIIAIFPVPTVMRAESTGWEKARVIAAFSAGAAVVIVSGIRIPTLAAAATGTDATLGPLASLVWSTIEVNLTIICAWLPFLKLLVMEAISPAPPTPPAPPAPAPPSAPAIELDVWDNWSVSSSFRAPSLDNEGGD